MKRFFLFILAFSVMAFTVVAQDNLTKGSIKGTVTDPSGAVVSGATVTVSGPTGDRTVTTNDEGLYEVTNLSPGNYSVKITQTGFKTVSSANTTVLVGRATTVDGRLEIGEASVTVDVTGGSDVDQASTATESNLNDQLFQNIPVARAVSGLFYLAPGATDSLGGGKDNPSISGGSALDNLYIADGVNITDSAFGGIGTFSRSYGALGTGINTSFVKEVQVKTAGFEAQYGQSQGGIVNIVTQSGGNEYHGALYAFARPKAFEATRRQPDDNPDRQNRFGKILHEETYDIGGDLGGYVPGARDRLFFFGSFNPTIRRDIFRGAEANSLNTDTGLRILRGEEFAGRTRTDNYAAKVEYQINPSHNVTFSIFGDPSETNRSSWRTLVTNNTTSDSVLDYGTRNMSFRYNGSWTPSLSVNASLGLGRSSFDESGFDNLHNIVDRRGSDRLIIEGFTGHLPATGNFSAIGLGFFEPTVSKTRRFDVNLIKTQTLWGQHSFGVGYTFQRGLYDGVRDRSGPRVTIPDLPQNEGAIGQTANIQFRLRFRPNNCGGLCPLYPVLLDDGSTALVPVRLQVIRSEFGDSSFTTYNNYHAGYIQDTWRFNKYVTGLFGLRWEQERLIGSPGVSGNRIGYTFTDQWAPRLGVTVDPMGRGNMKFFYNFGRFFQYIPLDLAERSLSAEQGWIGALFAPEFTIDGAGNRIAVINQFGTVNPIIDAAHQLPGQASVSIADPSNPIAPGTKLGFTDEHTFGYEQRLPHNFTFSARYIHRDVKRIVEDAASVSPEAANAGIHQVYYIANIGSSLDAATNLQGFQYTTGGAIPAGCLLDGGVPVYNYEAGATSVCFSGVGIDADGNAINVPDGIPDGFPDAVRRYRALEIEVNRRFSNGWQGFFNWRIASNKGNYEGHLRNDNGQTDPAISSLFDFTAGDLNLLGDQFAVGPLNTDRRHIINVFGSYNFSKDRGMAVLNGLNLGLNVRMESGLPVSELNSHPIYLNAGEIPVGGRGKLGRTPWYTRFDAHADYTWGITENTRLKFIGDFFNIFNSRKLRRPDEFGALDFDAATLTNPPNPDFMKARNYHPPFNMRLGVRWEF